MLAPSRVVKAADVLHEAEHKLVTVSFMESLPSAQTLDGVVAPVRRARAMFLETARSTLRLSDAAAIEHHHRGIGWHKFRVISQAPEQHYVVQELQSPPGDGQDRS